MFVYVTPPPKVGKGLAADEDEATTPLKGVWFEIPFLSSPPPYVEFVNCTAVDVTNPPVTGELHDDMEAAPRLDDDEHGTDDVENRALPVVPGCSAPLHNPVPNGT